MIVLPNGECVPERRKQATCGYVKEIIETHKAIYGNGDPEHGLYWKVTQNTEFINEFKKNIGKIVWVVLLGCASAIGGFIVSVIRLVWQHT